MVYALFIGLLVCFDFGSRGKIIGQMLVRVNQESCVLTEKGQHCYFSVGIVMSHEHVFFCLCVFSLQRFCVCTMSVRYVCIVFSLCYIVTVVDIDAQ